MVLEGEILAKQVVEVGVEASAAYLGRVEKLEGSGCRVSRIGKQGFAGLGTFGIEAVEFFPRHHDFAAYLEEVGVAAALQAERNAAYCAYVVGNDVALLAVAACDGTHQFAVFVDKRYACAVKFHFAHNRGSLAEKSVVDTIGPRVHIVDRVCVGQREHGVYVLCLFKALAYVGAYAACG